MNFSKTLIAAATVTVLTSVAQAEVKTDGLLEIYGRASFSVDQLDDGDKYKRMNLSSNASRLGFRGSKKIGELTGIWQIEQEIQFNLSNGNTETNTFDKKDTNNRLASRDTFAGLQGDFGTVTLGRQYTSYFLALNQVADPFASGLAGNAQNLMLPGASNAITNADRAIRMDNAIKYATPIFENFSGEIAYGFGEVASDSEASRVISASVGYDSKP